MNIKQFTHRLVFLFLASVLLISSIGLSDSKILAKPQDSITILKPRLQEILLGTTDYTIEWSSQGLENQPVRITLYNARTNKKVLIIKKEQSNSGSCPWYVPASLQTGAYKIRIRVIGTTISAISKVFTIRNPNIQGPKKTPTLTKPAARPIAPKKVNVETIDPNLGDNHDLQIVSFLMRDDELVVKLGNNGESFFTGPVGFYIKLLNTSGQGREGSKTINVNLGPRSQKEFILLKKQENFLRSLWQWVCSFNVEMTVDYQGLIPETNENNNSKRETIYSDKLMIEGNSITAGRRNLKVGNGTRAIITLHSDVYEVRTPDKKFFKIKISFKVKNCAGGRILHYTIRQWWSVRLPNNQLAALVGPEESNAEDLLIQSGASQDIIMESKLPQSRHSSEYNLRISVTNNQTGQLYDLFDCDFTLRIVDGL